MRHKKIIILLLAALSFSLTQIAQAQSSSLWKFVSSTLQPVVSSWTFTIPTLGGSGVRCVQTDNNGLVSKAAAACGSGGGVSGTGSFNTLTFWNNSGGTTIGATSSPTVGYITATSTTASLLPYASSTAWTLTGALFAGANLPGTVGQYLMSTASGIQWVASTTLSTISGILGAANGGTGQSTYSVGDILSATGATTLSKLNLGASSTILISNGTNPVWQKGTLKEFTNDAGFVTSTGVTSITAGTNVTITEGSPCTTSCTINSSGGASLSGGSPNDLTYWTSATAVSATGSPTVGYITATTTSTSTYTGPIVASTYTAQGGQGIMTIQNSSQTATTTITTASSATSTISGPLTVGTSTSIYNGGKVVIGTGGADSLLTNGLIINPAANAQAQLILTSTSGAGGVLSFGISNTVNSSLSYSNAYSSTYELSNGANATAKTDIFDANATGMGTFGVNGTNLASIAAPTLTLAAGGSVANNTYFYIITATDYGGHETSQTLNNQSSGVTTSGGNNTVKVAWTGISGAAFYSVYRTTTSGTYSSPALIATTTATTYIDAAAAAQASAIPTFTYGGWGNFLNPNGASFIGGGSLNVMANNNSGATIFSVASTTATSTATTTFFNVLASGNVGVGTTTPGSLLGIQGVANFTTATTTHYSTGGINLTAGCFAVNNACITSGAAGPAGSNSWSTTTSSVAGELVNYSNNNTDIVSVGSNSTTTAKFFADPNFLGGTASTSHYLAGDGSLVNPSYAFGSSKNTGIYDFSGHTALVESGQLQAYTGNGLNTFQLTTSSGGSGFYIVGGTSPTASAPTYAYNDHHNSGVYESSANITSVTSNGTETFRTDIASTSIPVGNFGVGTTSPYRTLSVNGSSDLGTNALAGTFTATTTTATSTFAGAFQAGGSNGIYVFPSGLTYFGNGGTSVTGNGIIIEPAGNVQASVQALSTGGAGSFFALGSGGSINYAEGFSNGYSSTAEYAPSSLFTAGNDYFAASARGFGTLNLIGNLITGIGAPTLTAQAGGSIPNGTYFYTIVPVDYDGNQGAGRDSSQNSIVLSGGNGTVKVSWTGVSGAAYYRVLRSTSSGTYNSPSLVASTVATTYIDAAAALQTGDDTHYTFGTWANVLNRTGASYIGGGSLNIMANDGGTSAALFTVGSTTATTTSGVATTTLFQVVGTGATSIATTTTTGTLNLGYDPSSTASTSIMMGKIEIDGYSNTGGHVCAQIVGTVWVIAAGGCIQ